MGYIRFMVQSKSFGDASAYTILYLMLVIFTVMFTFTYLKRVLYMAFLTMISPLVALTYPIDKIGDGKAQAFNMWFKEYLMNAILQPVHLILYTALVSSAASLVVQNVIYGVVAIGFLIPAEKFIKKMFRLDRGETPGGLGSFAAGTLVSQAMNRIGKNASGKVDKLGKGNSSNDSSEDNLGPRGKSIRYAGGNAMNNATAEIGTGNENRNNGQEQGNGNDNGRRTNSLTGNNENSQRDNMDNYNSNENGEDNVDNPLDTGDYYDNLDIPYVGRPLNNFEQASVPASDLTEQEPDFSVSNSDYPNITAYRSGYAPGTEPNPPTPEEPQRFTSPSLRERVANSRFGRATGAVASDLSAKRQRTFNKDNVKKAIKNGAKTGFRTAVRVGGMAATAAAVAPLAIAAGATTGDFGKATSIITGSVGLASTVGGNFAAKQADRVFNSADEEINVAKEGARTPDERKTKKQAEYDRKWKLDEKNLKYLRNHGVQNPNKWMKDDKVQAFLDAGFTNVGMIHKSLEIMDKTNKAGGNMTIEGAISRAQIAKESTNIGDASNREALEKRFLKKNPNMDYNALSKYLDDVADIQSSKS